ncbi:MAG TPA: M56 family metallopeptidase [Chitinophagaceae bacterium]|jgi:hypothetical protein|nr:M56 family metallopeptidase [Chitinophagaceae bacterium]
MPFLLIYILKLSVSLAVVFTFYHFVLRKLTFYNWNRWYLLGYSFLCFFIALIDIAPVLDRNDWSQASIVQWVPVIQSSATGSEEIASTAPLSTWQWFSLLIVAGMLVMLVRLVVQLLSFRRLMRKAQPIAVGRIPGSNMKLYQVEEDIIPFSFGNSIFINHRLHTRDELQEIVWHEFIHVKQKHSLDIIAGEILCLLNWYNPFAWLIRRSIRENLEFIADDKVLENGVNRKEYQYLLLKVIGNKHFSIAPKFNFSSLKKRIAMMNKMKSAGVHIVKFLFILPLIAVLLVAFRNDHETKRVAGIYDRPGQDTLPLIWKAAKMPKEISGLVIQNTDDTNIADPIRKKLSGMVIVKRTDGEKEVYDLDTKESLDKFEKKYGVKLEDLVPPPSVIPPPPVEGISGIPPTFPDPPIPPARSIDEEAPVAVSNSEGYYLSRISSEWEITDKKAQVKLKDGTVEKYDLTSPKEKAAFEKKYGKIYHVNANVSTTVAPTINTNLKTSVATILNTNVATGVNANVNNNATINTVITIPPTAIAEGSNLVTSVAPVTIAGEGITTVATSVSPQGGLATTAIDPYSNVITGKEDIIITVTKNTTRDELDKFIIQAKSKGVKLEFDDIEYNDKGKLVRITGTMSSGGSKSNFVVCDFTTLVLAMIKKGDKTWLKVHTKDNEVI